MRRHTRFEGNQKSRMKHTQLSRRPQPCVRSDIFFYSKILFFRFQKKPICNL